MNKSCLWHSKHLYRFYVCVCSSQIFTIASCSPQWECGGYITAAGVTGHSGHQRPERYQQKTSTKTANLYLNQNNKSAGGTSNKVEPTTLLSKSLINNLTSWVCLHSWVSHRTRIVAYLMYRLNLLYVDFKATAKCTYINACTKCIKDASFFQGCGLCIMQHGRESLSPWSCCWSLPLQWTVSLMRVRSLCTWLLSMDTMTW